MPGINYKNKTIQQLLSIQAAVIEELCARKVLRTKNNPVGDYAEWLVAKKLRLHLTSNSNSGYDAINKKGVRYQIKARRVTPHNTSTQLGIIRDLDKNAFDFLVGVIFDINYKVKYAVKIPHDLIAGMAIYRKRVNGHVLHLRPSVLEERNVRDITNNLL